MVRASPSPSPSQPFALVLAILGCAAPAPAEPAVEETFTMQPDAVRPLDVTVAESPYGPSPWVGRLVRATHRYSNGCTDQREVDLIALAMGERRAPILIGWRRASPHHRVEPRFLRRVEELPEDARDVECVSVSGALVAYAYEGISGAPASGIEASRIAPSPCP